MARNPTIPRSKTNPIGQTKRIARVRSAAFQDIARAQKIALETVASWPVELRNAFRANAYYEFLIDTAQIDRLIAEITTALKNGGGSEAARRAAEAAFREGVAKSTANLSALTDLITQSVTERLADQQVLRRSVLAGARAFEQMQGFADETATDLGRVLFEAVQRGENPKQTAKTIRERFNVSKTRAERIARTEIAMAQRRGRWDEAREQQQKLGMEVRLLHNSALIFGRTRDSHARRHGKIVTVEEEAAWYAQDGNAINCLCSQTEIIVDEDGQPLFGQELVQRMGIERAKFLGTAPPKPRKQPEQKPKKDPRAEALERINANQQLFSEAQDGAFNSAPLLVMRAIEKVGDIREMVPSNGAWADFRGRISMGKMVLGTLAYQRVFRHEYGHFIDNAIAKGNDITGGPSSSLFASFKAIDKLAEDTKVLEASRTASFMGFKTSRKEQARLGAALDEQRIRTNEILGEIIDSGKTKEAWLDDFLSDAGISARDLAALFGVEPSEMSSMQIASLAAAWERKDVNQLLFYLPRDLGLKIDHGTAFAGLQDTFEAGANGLLRIYFGHGKSYYADGSVALKPLGLQKKIGQRSYSGYNTGQAFANWFEAYSDPNPATAAVYRHLFPGTFEVFEAMLKEFVEG